MGRIPSSTRRQSGHSAPCVRCRARTAHGSRAPTCATVSTKTVSPARCASFVRSTPATNWKEQKMRLTDKALQSEFLSTCERLSEGRVAVRTPDGATYRFGTTGDEVDMVIRDWSAVSAMAAHGQVGLGEAYVQGLW